MLKWFANFCNETRLEKGTYVHTSMMHELELQRPSVRSKYISSRLAVVCDLVMSQRVKMRLAITHKEILHRTF